MICFGIGALLQLREDQHLILMGVVGGRLAGRHALAGHDHRDGGLHRLVGRVDAGRRGDDHAARRAVDGEHRPRRERRRGQGQEDRQQQNESCHWRILHRQLGWNRPVFALAREQADHRRAELDARDPGPPNPRIAICVTSPPTHRLPAGGR